MNWTVWAQSSQLLGSEHGEIKSFLVHLNNVFVNPDFHIKDDYSFENSGDSILIIVRFDPQWQAEVEQLNEIKEFNRSKISEVRLLPREDKEGCFIHIKWLKVAQVPLGKPKEKKRKTDFPS